MPWPSAPRASWCRLPAWGSLPPAPAAEPGSRRHPVPDPAEIVLQPLLEGRDGLPVHPRRSLVLPHLLPGAPDLVPGHRERPAVQGPPDTVRRLPSGLSSSMTLLPAHGWLTRRMKPRASRPLRSSPHRARQEDQHYYEPVRLPARQRFPPLAHPALAGIPLATPSRGSRIRAGPPVPCGRRRPGSRHLYAGHHLASNPGNRQAHPGDSYAPRFRCHLDLITTPQTVNAPAGKPRHGRFQRNAFLVPA